MSNRISGTRNEIATMKVLKFGGSSVASPERIEGIVQLLKEYYARGEKFTVVFSAFGGVTDSLILMAQLAAKGDDRYLEHFSEFRERHQSTAKALLNDDYRKEVLPRLDENHEVLKNLLYGIFLVREASDRTMDYVLSFGERNSAFFISQLLRQNGVQASYLDARKVIKTDRSFGNAKVDLELTYRKVQGFYSENTDIQIVTGFIGSTKGGLTTTLGRGGSDFTASLLAAALDAEHIEIWTDVDGVLTADPRKVRKAFTIPAMSYAEAMEMSHFGAKVIYPPTLQPAMSKKIPLYIRNTFNPSFPGTFITDQPAPDSRAVKGISSMSPVTLLTLSGSGLFGVPGTAARLFGILAQASINVILITQGSSEHSISFAILPQFGKKARKLLETAFEYEMSRNIVDPIRVEEDLSVVAIIGENMRYRPGIAGRMFEALGRNGVNAVAIAQGSSELNISVVINRHDESKALNALHEAFFLSDLMELHLFMVGVGLIGSTLLEQIDKQRNFLRERRGLDIKVTGLANSRKMHFDPDGIDLRDWKGSLVERGRSLDMNDFVRTMKDMNLPNAIFVDNTASDRIPAFYEQILDSSISIATPNKIATSSSFAQYLRLKNIAEKRGVPFRYETNVGAGLPVITTLNDLINSGDRIWKIEGVLSGSLSYIFNNFRSGASFSEVVRKAKEEGYTEPDPRIDLMGLDVRRKLVILAREAGLELESEQVTIDPFLPPVVAEAPSVEAFFGELEGVDQHFRQLVEKAEEREKVLRLVARLENGEARIGLEEVGVEHPFYHLSGSDNMIVFTTERYKDRPLVVRGPGAGAEVTAAGLFAEIIGIGHLLGR